MYYDEDVRDYGFDEPDRQFLMMTTSGERIDLLKKWDWYFDYDMQENDYVVVWKLQIDGNNYHIEEEHDKEKLIKIALILFEEDKEATAAINEHINEMIHEQKMLGEY